MRRVSQRQLVAVDENGIRIDRSAAGDCFPACIASIFELPLDQAPGIGGNTQQVFDWLALNFPGIGCVSRDWLEPRTTWHNGFWIATVVSSRFRNRTCGRCTPDRRRKSDPPYFWRRDECPNCDGTGHGRGLHAVVMEHGKLAWDPHPDADFSEPQIVGETTFVVTDPARLAARILPRPL